jgi:polyisoprenoid-binding protein YceI
MSLLATPSLADLTSGVWTVDSSHSTIGFVARHLMVSKVRGHFGTFTGTLTIADDPLASKVEASAETASITTGDDTRDNHLRSADFFDVENFPTISFASTGIDRVGSSFVLHADLTIKGVTKPVDFELEFDGVTADPWGGTRGGFSAEAEINRKDWGLTWNVAIETGGVVVGEKIKIQLEVEVVKA